MVTPVRHVVLLLLGICAILNAAALPPLICASGGAVGTVDLRVSSAKNTAQPLPLRTIVRLEEGEIIHYKPILRPREKREGDVTLVLVPAAKKSGREHFLIFPPKPAAQPQEWTVPWTTSLVAFVYGPSGLNAGNVESFLEADDDLIGNLADYADKTAKTEALIAALSSPDSSNEAVNAFLHGFSSQFGTTVPLSHTAPADRRAAASLRTLNPGLATYDPLAGQGAQPVGQSASLATSAAEMFFGNSPIGLAASGTAMLLNLAALAFPRSEFRSMLSQPMPDDALGMCAKTGAPAVHTRVAYLWAVRIPNVATPKLAAGKANSLPAGIKSPLPLVGTELEWKYLDHARNWEVAPESGKAIPVKVQALANPKTVELVLDKAVKPGRYTLRADWDWDGFEVSGSFDVRPLADFTTAKLTPAAQERLVAGEGKVPVTLEGSDFEFVTKIQIKKLNDEFASASNLPFVLPKGLRGGVQERMDIQADTSDLDAGSYDLTISQVDAKSHEVHVLVLPPAPVIDNLPFQVNQDVSTVAFEFTGKRLDLIERIELAEGKASLEPASEDGTRRKVALIFTQPIAAGSTLPLHALVFNRTEPLTVGDALRVVPPRPAISEISLSDIPPQAVEVDKGELPSGLMLNAMIKVAHLAPGSGVRLRCEQTSSGAVTVQPGAQGRDARIEQLTADQLFLTFNTGTWVNGCKIQASVTGTTGDSDPRPIGKVVNIPFIEQFNLTANANGEISAELTGRGLETIAKVGWTPDQGSAVLQLPQPISSDGIDQKLKFRLPAPPAPDSPLFIWLREDTSVRITSVRAN